MHRLTRSDLYYAVWMHTCQCQFRNQGWLTDQGQIELEEAVATFRQAEQLGMDIPSIAQACDYYNR